MSASWPFGELRPFYYDVIVLDPPWDFSLYSDAGAEKSASAQYETMSLDEIVALPVDHLARGDCLVLMWTCSWMQPKHRQACFDAWNVTYKTELVWRKTTRNGKVRMGVGYRARSCHETLYLGTIGNPLHKPFPSLFDGLARQHSRKPDEFYKTIEKHSPRSFRLDMFSRQSRPGWDNWGNQSTLFDDGNEAVPTGEANGKERSPAGREEQTEEWRLF